MGTTGPQPVAPTTPRCLQKKRPIYYLISGASIKMSHVVQDATVSKFRALKKAGINAANRGTCKRRELIRVVHPGLLLLQGSAFLRQCSAFLPQCSAFLPHSAAKLRLCARKLRPCARKLRPCARKLRPSARKLRPCARKLHPCARKLRKLRKLRRRSSSSSFFFFFSCPLKTSRNSTISKKFILKSRVFAVSSLCRSGPRKLRPHFPVSAAPHLCFEDFPST